MKPGAGFLGRVLRALAAVLLCTAALAQAGQECRARKPSEAELRQGLELAASTARALDATGARVAVLARVGQDLRAYGLRYSHLGFVYRDDSALGGRGAWRVVHKLNQCGTDRADLYRQGLAEFFSDGLYAFEAGLAPLAPDAAAKLLPMLQDSRALTRLHEPRYNMLAYAWATRYQQSNQWAIETLASVLEPVATTRERAQAWLRLRDYRPTTVRVPALQRLGARVGTAHIAFDDHPFGRRMSDRIDTVTVDSVFEWLERSRLGDPARVVRAEVPARPWPERSAGDAIRL